MKRSDLLDVLVQEILDLDLPHPTRVGIDGVDAAGKTVLANELHVALQIHERPVIRASTDGFHHPKSVRYRNGRYSPVGYFRDSINHQALRDLLLKPLGPRGSLIYRSAIFDYHSDAPKNTPWENAVPNAILLCDGIFLHQPDLRDLWEFSIYLDVDVQVSIARLAERDGLDPDSGNQLIQRYTGGQKLYYESCQPQRQVDFVIDNNDWSNPLIIRSQ